MILKMYKSIKNEPTYITYIHDYKITYKLDFDKLLVVIKNDINILNNMKDNILINYSGIIYLTYTYADNIRNIFHFFSNLYSYSMFKSFTNEEMSKFKLLVIMILEMYINEQRFFIYKETNILFNNGIHPCISFESRFREILYLLYENDRYFYGNKINKFHIILFGTPINIFFSLHFNKYINVLEEIIKVVWNPLNFCKWKYLLDDIEFECLN